MTILKNASTQEIRKSIVTNYYQSWSDILSPFGMPDPHDLFGVNGFLSGIPYMMMNSLFDGDLRMTHADVEQVLAYFRERQIPMMWFVSPVGMQAGIDVLLRELDVEEAAMKVPGMAVDLTSVEDNILEEQMKAHQLRQIDPDSPGDISAYVDIFMQAFEVDPSIAEPMSRFASVFPTHPTSSHYFAQIDNQPVAAASVIYAAGVAGIYNVATHPNYQRQGCASALMGQVMTNAKERGYQYSILHSSERGKKVYQRLGYDDYFTFGRFLLRPRDVGLA